MKNFIFLLLVSGLCHAQDRREVQFRTDDDLLIFGDLYYSDESKPIILLFHQAGACARGEYGKIIPTLRENGYNVLAVDQRSGGSRLGDTNRTVARLQGKEYGYCDTYPDFEAALSYVENEIGHSGKIIAWGSSYSAAMVVHLKSDYPDKITGVLAFSPASGGPMQACSPNEKFSQLDKRTLILRPEREMKVPSVIEQFDLAKQSGLSTHVSPNGVHGSSMLNADRVSGSTAETWRKVLDFLNGL